MYCFIFNFMIENPESEIFVLVKEQEKKYRLASIQTILNETGIIWSLANFAIFQEINCIQGS